MHYRSTQGRWRSAVCLLGVATLLAGCQANEFQSSEDTDPITGALGDPLVMLGLKPDPNETYIEYGPRSPLVLPSDSELPPPQQQAANYGPSWPEDPDVLARREYEEQRRAALQSSVEEELNASRTLSRAELDDWGRRFGRVDPNPQPYSRSEASQAMSPQELRAGEGDPNALRGEPERRSLTEPPPGYRAPAPTAAAAAPEPEKKGFFSRLFGR